MWSRLAIVLLAAGVAKAMGRIEDGVDHGLHTFFFLDAGAFAPRIRRSLAEAGLVRQAEIFGRVMALFGEPYPRDRTVRERPFAWSRQGTRVDEFTTIPNDLNAFDLRLIDMSRDFGSRPKVWGEIEAFVRLVPALTAWAEDARAAVSDEERVRGRARGRGPGAHGRDDEGLAKAVPPPLPPRDLQRQDAERQCPPVLLQLVREPRAGGGGGAEGGRAREARRRRPARDRPLPCPYPTDTERRRDLYCRHEETTPFDEVLAALTGDVDDGAILDAMIALAKRDGVLPR